ncbi:unnamed protein product [Adineta steineri]|nr:unnamed protein product [Adineta steineri]CAF0797976.1 unnamed protein product [Adineta steineri]
MVPTLFITNISTPTSTTTSTTTSITTTTVTGPISLISADGTVYGVRDTYAGSDSLSTDGIWLGQFYPVGQSPDMACDDNTSTKYLNFGDCGPYGDSSYTCGLSTGFYLELQRGASTITGFQVCTGGDSPERDPTSMTIEGSDESGSALTLGSIWTLIYSGITGLAIDPGRYTCAMVQLIDNPIQYKSYRFLITGKRSSSNSVQYSEVHLFGY